MVLNLTDWERALLSVYTTYCRGGNGAGLEKILPSNQTKFYGFGRQALAEGLRRIGVRPGDRVLLPGFVCHEVLASLAVLGVTPRFYAVDEMLSTDAQSLERMDPNGVRAVIVVNYFGFPQPLDRILEWCKAYRAVLIEDNAHGFLSRESNVPLGQRGDMGIFSLRKTLSLPNGAALVDNRPGQVEQGGLTFKGSPLASVARYRLKNGLKRLMSLGRLHTARSILGAIRMIRSASTGDAIPISPPNAETEVPQEAFAWLTTRLLGRCNIEVESERRRSLYKWCNEVFAATPGVRPIFPSLPDGVVPQGFPFFYTGNDYRVLKRVWWSQGVQIVTWPERLPAALAPCAPEHYGRVMLIPFLW